MAPHSLIAFSVALGGGLLLVIAGWGHMRRPSVLRHALAAQRILPAKWCGMIARTVAVAEVLVGGCAVVAALSAMPVMAPPLGAQAALYGVFTGYLTLLRTRRPGAPCGCLRADEPATWLTVGRAAVFAVCTGMAAAMSTTLAATPVQWRLVGLAGGLVAAMAGWLIPLVLAPSPTRNYL